MRNEEGEEERSHLYILRETMQEMKVEIPSFIC